MAAQTATARKSTGNRNKKHPIVLSDLPPYPEDKSLKEELVHIVIETPKGSAHKLKYTPELGTFELKRVLPQGMVFPFDFGFIPRTLADDGDPEDVLLLLAAPLTPGVVVQSRLIGVMEAVQRQEGRQDENDRLIAVAPICPLYADVHTLEDVPHAVLDQIQQFFITYNAQCGKVFIPKGQHGPKRASQLLQEALQRFDAQQH